MAELKKVETDMVPTLVKEPSAVKIQKKNVKLAVVLIRGYIGMHRTVKDALYTLKLRKKHTCVVLIDNPSNRGMLNKVKDYVTYGEIDDSTIKELVAKRGKEDAANKGRTKPFFELPPPRGGFERKGIKISFRDGGALGYRADKINVLIRKMI